jgi:ABC-type sugar transport system ATPase subunit
VLKDGVIQQIGSPVEIYERPANRFVAGFFGTPTMNFLTADVSLSARPTTSRASITLSSPNSSMIFAWPRRRTT